MRVLAFFVVVVVLTSAALLAGSTLAEPVTVSVSEAVLPHLASSEDAGLIEQWLEWLRQNPPNETDLQHINTWYTSLKNSFSRDSAATLEENLIVFLQENNPYFGTMIGLKTIDYVDRPELNVWLYKVSFVVEQIALSDGQVEETITLTFHPWDKGVETRQYRLQKENDAVLSVVVRTGQAATWENHPVQTGYPPELEVIKEWYSALQAAYNQPLIAAQGVKLDCAEEPGFLADDCEKYQYIVHENGHFGVVEKILENGAVTRSRYLVNFMVAEHQIDETLRGIEYWFVITKDKLYSDYGIIVEKNSDGTETAYHYQRDYILNAWVPLQTSSPAPEFIGSVMLTNPQIFVFMPFGGLDNFLIY